MTPRPGLCAEHGGLMWSNAKRVCLTLDDVIRGGCQWRPLNPEEMGLVLYGEVEWDVDEEQESVRAVVDDCTPGAPVYVPEECVGG